MLEILVLTADSTLVEQEVAGAHVTHIATTEQLDRALAADISTSIVVIDQRLPRDPWRSRISPLLEGASRAACELYAFAPESGEGDLLTTNELLRFGIPVLQGLDAFASERIADADIPLAVRSDGGASEFRTLLGSSQSRRLLNDLVEVARAMRRATPKPIWDVNAAAASDLKLGEPADIAEDASWRNSESGLVCSKKRPPLRNLLMREFESDADKFLHFLDASDAVGHWQWDPSQRRFPVPPCVLISGETGTGKTAMARALHEALFPHDFEVRPFREISVPNIRVELWNDEFFGHTDKAYTSIGERVGPAVAAAFGTLFIDEIGDLDADGQVKLLTFLTRRMASIAGLTRDVFVPVQVIAATNRNVDDMVRDSRFRQDLLNRFRFRIDISPLRDRINGNREELRRLLEEFLSDPSYNPQLLAGVRLGEPTVTHLRDDVISALESRRFETGNIRELIDTLCIGVVNAGRRRSHVLTADDLPSEPEVVDSARSGAPIPLHITLAELERQLGKAVETADVQMLARRHGAPLLSTADGHLVAVADSYLWRDTAGVDLG